MVKVFFKQMIVASIILLVAASFSLKASASQTFSDVSVSADGYQEIEFIYNKGIIKGYQVNGKRLYKPGEVLTRSQAAKMLVEASSQKPLAVSKSQFKDVQVGTEMSSYIERAVKSGFMKGNSDGTFGINKPFSRGDMSIALTKAFNLDLTKYQHEKMPFSDVKDTDPIASYVKAVSYYGISQGDGGKYHPSEGVTRKQFAQFVARGLDEKFRLNKDVGGITIPDNTQSIATAVVTVKDDVLNVRSEPGISGHLVGQLHNGDIVYVYEKVDENWLKIDYQGELHYISSAYTMFLDEDGQVLGNATGEVRITAVELNIRSKASGTSAIVGAFLKGQVVEIYGEKNGWYLVKVDGIPGYINGKYAESSVDAPPVDSPSTSKLVGKVTVASLNVRSGPGASYATVGKLTKGTQVSVQSINGFWAKIEFAGGVGYTHKSYLKLLNQTGSVLKDRIILLDPGHGGKDPGASRKGAMEKTIVMNVGKLVEQKLKNQGAKVIMTRTGDTYPSLADRVALSKSSFSEIFVSIHVNATTSSSAKGTETFYNLSSNENGQESKLLATKINSQIVKNASMYNRGIKENSFYVNRMVDIPSVLIELGFISNQADFDKLVNSKYQEIYAQSIYNGIVEYYSAP